MRDQTAASVSIGRLPVGWYRIGWSDSSDKEVAWTTAAVLAPLTEPTPQDSPICVDSATAWFAQGDPVKQDQFSQLAALAGVNWVRDRMRWRDIQPKQDELRNDTTYDSSADIQPLDRKERRPTGRRAARRRSTGTCQAAWRSSKPTITWGANARLTIRSNSLPPAAAGAPKRPM